MFWVGSFVLINVFYGILSVYDGENWWIFNCLESLVLVGIINLVLVFGGGVWFIGINGGFVFIRDFVEVEVYILNDVNDNFVFGYRCIYYDE